MGHTPIPYKSAGFRRRLMPSAPQPSPGLPVPRPVDLLIGIPPLAAVVLGLTRYPMGVPFLAAALIAYGILLWRWPLLWLFVVPALLPTLDLSPLTGRLLLDEFDLTVLVTLAACYVRQYRVKPAPWPNSLLKVALVLLWITWGASMARGLWPLWSATGEVLASSHSPWEAWLAGKGLLWALLLVPLIRRVPPDAIDTARSYVLHGLIVGLAGVALAVLWERYVFVGLLNFHTVFRVTGTFASMNTGGAYIEAFIAFAFPVLAVWVVMQRSWTRKLLGIGMAGLVAYAMLVTFSRGGYAGLAVGLAVVAIGTLRSRAGSPARGWAALAGLTAAAIVVAVPVLSGSYAQYRLARSATDLTIREAHWRRALSLMDDGFLTAIFGMGFGAYPTAYLLYSGAPVPPGTYSVLRDDGNPFLRLTPGQPVFLDQLVDVQPHTRYRLSARLREGPAANGLSVALCEKALLYSFACIWRDLKPDKPGSGWSQVSVDVDSEKLGGGGNWPHRPVKLSLHNGGGGVVDLDDVSLKMQDGPELVANGDFSEGVDRWLFVTDQDLAWHIHEQWVETYFAQGLIGLAAMLGLLAGAVVYLWFPLLRGDMWATAVVGGLAAFVAVGLLGSTVDTPRLSAAFYFGLFLGGLPPRRGEA